jgi:beta-galactosidase/beta-glucuronidase
MRAKGDEDLTRRVPIAQETAMARQFYDVYLLMVYVLFMGLLTLGVHTTYTSATVWTGPVGGTGGSFAEWALSELQPQVTLSSCDGKVGPFAGSIPGQVHTDLMRAGVIKQDPLFRYEEQRLSWVAEQCWAYNVFFSLQQLGRALDPKLPLRLLFEQIDTVGAVYLNGELLGNTSNAFRAYSFELPTALHSDRNLLRLELAPARTYAQAQAQAYPYVVPETQNYNVWAEPSSRNFVRKAGSDMGWDWGPAFIPSGIGEVRLLQAPVGRLEGFSIRQSIAKDHASAELRVILTVSDIPPHSASISALGVGAAAAGTEVPVALLVDGVVVLMERVKLSGAPQQVFSLPAVTIRDLQLWWPIGMDPVAGPHGHSRSPYLYSVEVQWGQRGQRGQRGAPPTRPGTGGARGSRAPLACPARMGLT